MASEINLTIHSYVAKLYSPSRCDTLRELSDKPEVCEHGPVQAAIRYNSCFGEPTVRELATALAGRLGIIDPRKI